MIPLLCLLAGVAAPWAGRYFPVAALFSFLVVSYLLIRNKQYIALILLALGTLYGHDAYGPPVSRPDFSFNTVRLRGYFSSPAGRAVDGYTEEFHVVEPASLEGAIMMRCPKRFDAGDWYELDVKVHTPKTRINPGSTERAPYGVVEGYRRLDHAPEGGLMIAFGRMRERVNRYFESRYPPDESALLSSVTTGERGRMSAEAKDAFSATGLAHMLSISGSHFGLLLGVLLLVSLRMIAFMPRRWIERMTLHLSVRQVSATLAVPVLFFYLGLSGGSVPAVRSFLMVTLSLLGLFLGRKGDWLNMLLLAASVIVLWDPQALGSLSFQLSFTAVLFVCMGLGDKEHPQEKPIDEPWINRAGFRLWDIIKISLFVMLGTGPLIAYHFHTFSLISPVANLLVAPLMGMVMVPLALFGSIIYLITGYFPFSSLLGTVSGWSLKSTEWLGQIPFASERVEGLTPIAIAVYYAGFAARWIVRGRKQWNKRSMMYPVSATVLLLGIVAYSSMSRSLLSVTFLDAGQADTSVIELAGHKTVVVDTARTGREAGQYLRCRGIRRIDALALSHSHADHAGGAGYLVNAFDVRQIWDNGRLILPMEIDGEVPVRPIGRGDIIESGGARFTVLHPYEGYFSGAGSEGSETNNSSMVLKLEGTRGLSVLFAGDIEAEAEVDMAGLGPKRLGAMLLKAPHHGHVGRGSEELLRLVNPGYVIVNSEKTEPIEAVLAGSHTKVFYPSRDGAVRVAEYARGAVRVSVYGDYLLRPAGTLRAEWDNIQRLFMVW